MKLTATMMLSVDGVRQAPEAATASPAHVSSIAAASNLRFYGHSDGKHGLLPTDIFSTSVKLGARGDVSRDCEGSGTYVPTLAPAALSRSRPRSVRRHFGVP